MIFITKRYRLTAYLSPSILLLYQKNTTIFNEVSIFQLEVKRIKVDSGNNTFYDGIFSVNDVPLFNSLCTSISILYLSANILVILKPKPVPPCSLCLDSSAL